MNLIPQSDPKKAITQCN